MTLKLSLSGMAYATPISAYVPTKTKGHDIKGNFYFDLHFPFDSMPRSDNLIILGNFNAQVGSDHQIWNGVTRTCNSNGLLPLRTGSEYILLITNAFLQLWKQSGCIHRMLDEPLSSHLHNEHN